MEGSQSNQSAELKPAFVFGAFIPALFYFVDLGFSLHRSGGHYDDVALILVALGWLGVLAGARRPRLFTPRFRFGRRELGVALWLALVFFGALLLRDDRVSDVEFREIWRVMRGFLWGSFGFSLLGLGFSFRARLSPRLKMKTQLTFAAGIAVCLFAARVLVLRFSPHPLTDVFTVPTDGAGYFWHGMDPYSQSYPDIYHGEYGYKPVYGYWPGVLFLQTLFLQLFGDIRATFIFTDLVTAAALVWILRRSRWPWELACVAPLLWLVFPAGLFVLGQSWIDSLLVACVTVFVAMLLRRKWICAGIALGYFCATKQYAVFAAALSMVVLLAPPFRKDRAFWKTGFAAFGTFLLILLPFAIWDWRGFYADTIGFFVNVPIRTDSLSIVASLARNAHWEMPRSLNALIYAAAVAGGAVWIWRKAPRRGFKSLTDFSPWAGGLVLVYGVVFLFGKLAFCNYYYFLAYFALLLALSGVSFDSPDSA